MSVQPTSKQFLPGLQRSATTALAPFQREFNRLLDDLASGWNSFADLELAPSMDVRETKDAVEVTMEVPGISMEDVKVELEDNVLTIRGEKKSETEEKSDNRRVSERIYGSFERSLTLPSSVQADKIKAMMDKGVLTIVAPKSAATSAKTIKIEPAK